MQFPLADGVESPMSGDFGAATSFSSQPGLTRAGSRSFGAKSQSDISRHVSFLTSGLAGSTFGHPKSRGAAFPAKPTPVEQTGARPTSPTKNPAATLSSVNGFWPPAISSVTSSKGRPLSGSNRSAVAVAATTTTGHVDGSYLPPQFRSQAQAQMFDPSERVRENVLRMKAQLLGAKRPALDRQGKRNEGPRTSDSLQLHQQIWSPSKLQSAVEFATAAVKAERRRVESEKIVLDAALKGPGGAAAAVPGDAATGGANSAGDALNAPAVPTRRVRCDQPWVTDALDDVSFRVRHNDDFNSVADTVDDLSDDEVALEKEKRKKLAAAKKPGPTGADGGAANGVPKKRPMSATTTTVSMVSGESIAMKYTLMHSRILHSIGVVDQSTAATTTAAPVIALHAADATNVDAFVVDHSASSTANQQQQHGDGRSHHRGPHASYSTFVHQLAHRGYAPSISGSSRSEPRMMTGITRIPTIAWMYLLDFLLTGQGCENGGGRPQELIRILKRSTFLVPPINRSITPSSPSPSPGAGATKKVIVNPCAPTVGEAKNFAEIPKDIKALMFGMLDVFHEGWIAVDPTLACLGSILYGGITDEMRAAALSSPKATSLPLSGSFRPTSPPSSTRPPLPVQSSRDTPESWLSFILTALGCHLGNYSIVDHQSLCRYMSVLSERGRRDRTAPATSWGRRTSESPAPSSIPPPGPTKVPVVATLRLDTGDSNDEDAEEDAVDPSAVLAQQWIAPDAVSQFRLLQWALFENGGLSAAVERAQSLLMTHFVTLSSNVPSGGGSVNRPKRPWSATVGRGAPAAALLGRGKMTDREAEEVGLELAQQKASRAVTKANAATMFEEFMLRHQGAVGRSAFPEAVLAELAQGSGQLPFRTVMAWRDVVSMLVPMFPALSESAQQCTPLQMREAPPKSQQPPTGKI